MNLLKLLKSYKILIAAAMTCIKGDINCVEIKNTNVIKYKMHNDSYSTHL
jgi:hypothetical protein